MTIKKHDYVIASATGNGRAPYLMKVLEASNGEVIGVVEKMCHIQGMRLTNTEKASNVMVNLGHNPPIGKVYGVDVSSRFCGRKTHDKAGTINFFYKPSKTVCLDLWKAFDKVYVILKKRGLEFLLDDIVWEIIPYNGEKYAGRFMKSKNEKVPDRIQLRPEILPASEYVELILHELGHSLHFNYAKSKKLNATWVRLFNTSIKVTAIKKEVSQTLLDALMAQEDPPSAFKGQLGEDEALAYKWVLRTIQSMHSLSVKELDLLFEADMREDVRKLWPIRSITRKELAPIISQYATTNYKETLAETFAYTLVGKKLPAPIVALLDKTIAYAKANKNPKGADE